MNYEFIIADYLESIQCEIFLEGILYSEPT